MSPPDINTMPTSPRAERPPQPSSNSASRRASQIMPPPTHPASASMSAVAHSPQMSRSPIISQNEQLPMRHPRPLTAAELMLECEKESEAVVNRLTRELTALRAQSASVASNVSSVSSTSASILPVDITDTNPTHQIVGATHPTPSRRHRTSSSASARSFNTNMSTAGSGITNISTSAQPTHSTSVPLSGISQASADRAAAATGDRTSLSRNPSVSASGTSTPARQSMDNARSSSSHYTLPHRPALSRDPSQATVSSTVAQPGTPAPPGPIPSPSPAQSPSAAQAMQHYADTTAYRTEMEIVKAENEALRQRVRALESALRARRRDSSTSESQRVDLNTISGSRENLARLPEVTSGRERADSRPSREFNRVPSFTSPPQSAGLGVWDSGIGGVAGPRERSESQSTTASSRRAVGVTEEEVRLGESASSTGIPRVP